MSKVNTKIGILGAGSFGLALATLYAREGQEVTLWDRTPEKIAFLSQNRAIKTPYEFTLPDSVILVSDLKFLAHSVDIIILSVTSKGTRPICKALSKVELPVDVILVNVSKGFEPQVNNETSLLRMSQVIQEELPQNPVAVLSGPSLAKELLAGLPTAISVATENIELAERLMTVLSCESCLRLYANTDVIGVELGGTLKNIYAIGAGYLIENKLGHNALAAYITRSLSEMTRFAVSVGAEPETLYGLSGLGDLSTTCHSPLSRNYQIGVRLAQGQPLVEVMKTLVGTAEGVASTRALVASVENAPEMLPIAATIARLLGENPPMPVELIQSLMTRRPRVEC